MPAWCTFPGLSALKRLFLGGNPITDLGLAHLTGLPSLQDLGLYRTEVTAAGLVHLQKMSALSRLELSGSQITDAVIANLREALPNVRIDDGSPLAPPPPTTRVLGDLLGLNCRERSPASTGRVVNTVLAHDERDGA